MQQNESAICVCISPLFKIFLSYFGPHRALDGKESSCHVGDLGVIPGSEISPREENVYSSILAWRIPWTKEPGRLQSMRSQRVRHNLATKQQGRVEQVIVRH